MQVCVGAGQVLTWTQSVHDESCAVEVGRRDREARAVAAIMAMPITAAGVVREGCQRLCCSAGSAGLRGLCR
jgi:hypothetical protein